MASTNDFIKLYSTVQTNTVGSTITTGFIPYISTGGRQGYTSTLSTLTVSSLVTTTMAYPINTTQAATTAYISSATGTLLTTTNTWASNNTFNTDLTIPNYGNLTNTITSLAGRLNTLEANTIRLNTLYRMSGRVTVNGRDERVDYYLSDGYIPRADGGGAWYGNRWLFKQ